jgi:flagellin
MSIVVNTNATSLSLQQSLSGSVSDVKSSMARLASGVRVNSAADDAASLALSKKLSAQTSSSNVAKNNANTAINMFQTMDSDLAQVQSNLQRMRDLATQAANGVYSDTERSMLDKEFGALWEENARIIKSSKFADKNLFNVTADGGDNFYFNTASADVQIGTNNKAEDRLSFGSTTVGIDSPWVSSQLYGQTSIDCMDDAIKSVSSARSQIGATINRLQGSVTRTDTRKENLTNATSTIVDTDYGSETASLTKSQILEQSNVAIMQQAKQQSAMALQLLQ